MNADGSSLLLALLALPTSAALAQVRIAGRVVDSVSGRPVALAAVVAELSNLPYGAATTDSLGRFSVALGKLLPHSNSIVIHVRRIGFAPKTTMVVVGEGVQTVVSVEIALRPLPLRIESLAVVANEVSRKLLLSGFEARRREGFGSFVTQQDIAFRNPHLTSDVVRMIPGVRVSADAAGVRIVIARAESSRLVGGPCPPQVFVDGLLVPNPVDLDQLSVPTDIAGIEVYRGPAQTPSRFGGAGSACGVIVFWTK